MNPARFNFAGFSLVRIADTTTHEVEIGKVTMGGNTFVVELVRKAGLHFQGSFLLAKVFDAAGDVELWSFKSSGFDGLGLLAQAGDEPVVALCKNGRNGDVQNIVPFSSFTEHRPISIERKLALKRAAAEFLGRKYDLTKVEASVHQKVIDAARAAEEAKRAADVAARQEARQALRMRVASRGKITVFTADGQKRYGYPVTDAEWPSLSKGTFVVLCDSYNQTALQHGKVIESFQVVKEHGKKAEKAYPARVSLDLPRLASLATAELPKPVDTIAVETDDGAFEVAVYATMDDIRAARAGGLNSGTYVAARDRQTADGRFEVLSVRTDGIVTVGRFAAL